jgi:hypothetical protein
VETCVEKVLVYASRIQSAEQPLRKPWRSAGGGLCEEDPTEDVDGGTRRPAGHRGCRRPSQAGARRRHHQGIIRPIDIVDFRMPEIGCTIRQVARAAVQRIAASSQWSVRACRSIRVSPRPAAAGRRDGSRVFGGETSFSGSGAGGADGRCRGPDLLSIRRRKTPRGNGDDARNSHAGVRRVERFVAPHYVRFTVADPRHLADIFAPHATPSTSRRLCSCRSAEGSPAVRGDLEHSSRCSIGR